MLNINFDLNKIKITVVTNCHCLPIADTLALSVPGIRTDFIDVSFLHDNDTIQKIDSMMNGEVSDLIFSLNISENFKSVSTEMLRKTLDMKIVTFTNTYFNGLHPDITYLGAMGHRVHGYMGDYHSKLVVFSFVSGLTKNQCRGLFNGKTYDALGYFGAFITAADDLRARDDACDVRFAEKFIEMVQERPSLYTINHPTGHVFLEISRRLADYANLQFIEYDPSQYLNHLSNNFIWPVYNEIAESNNLKYRTPQYFVRGYQRASRGVDLENFIAGSYDSYSTVDFNEFSEVVKSLEFYSKFSEILDILS